MIKFIETVFLAHPKSINETYLQHLGYTIKKACFLVKTAVALILHGLFPCIFETYTRDKVLKFSDELLNRSTTNKAKNKQ